MYRVRVIEVGCPDDKDENGYSVITGNASKAVVMNMCMEVF